MLGPGCALIGIEVDGVIPEHPEREVECGEAEFRGDVDDLQVIDADLVQARISAVECAEIVAFFTGILVVGRGRLHIEGSC